MNKLLAPRIVAASQGSTEQRVIPLFHPLACALAESTPRFKLAETDILSLSADSCDVARVMSVLFNWPDELRQQALKSIASSVRDGGLMVVGQQTGASPLHLRCSIFRRCGMRMEWVGTLGRAAKEHDTILALEI